MRKITAELNEAGTGITITSEYNRAVLKDWCKEYKYFDITPKAKKSRKRQAFLEAAVIPCWGKHQYGLDPRKPKDVEIARILFKQDFHYDIIKDRDGNPRKIMKSLAGHHEAVLEAYTEYAEQNGAPIPNVELYKKYIDEYSFEFKWSNYWDWLDALGLECDAMPSREAFDVLK